MILNISLFDIFTFALSATSNFLCKNAKLCNLSLTCFYLEPSRSSNPVLSPHSNEAAPICNSYRDKMQSKISKKLVNILASQLPLIFFYMKYYLSLVWCLYSLIQIVKIHCSFKFLNNWFSWCFSTL